MKKTAIVIFTILLVFIYSCNNKPDERVQNQLDLTYEQLQNDYSNNKKVYGKYKSAHIYNDLEFEFFIAKVQLYSKNRMYKELSRLIRYPLKLRKRATKPNEPPFYSIKNAADFVKQSEIIITKNRLKSLSEQDKYHFTVTKDLNGLDDDNRVLIGKHGHITYERKKTRGIEEYYLTAIF